MKKNQYKIAIYLYGAVSAWFWNPGAPVQSEISELPREKLQFAA